MKHNQKGVFDIFIEHNNYLFFKPSPQKITTQNDREKTPHSSKTSSIVKLEVTTKMISDFSSRNHDHGRFWSIRKFRLNLINSKGFICASIFCYFFFFLFLILGLYDGWGDISRVILNGYFVILTFNSVVIVVLFLGLIKTKKFHTSPDERVSKDQV